eukprot:GEMP01010812.1.p1 GENE.GEMP01010812.1~~GEMP01010812.1.p1  ORF type:complete len:479 (+),score=109.22 GEMP01010812.1:34-1437(+)
MLTELCCSDLYQEATNLWKEQRYFDCIQKINAALEDWERRHMETAEGVVLTDPLAFLARQGEKLATLNGKTELSQLYDLRMKVLLHLGATKRAHVELEALQLLGHADETESLEADLKRLEKKQLAEIRSNEGTKVPVTIITGFLGSGKTTLLNKILAETHGKRLAIIENEYGEVGVDDALIMAREDLGNESIIEMNNGCICCTVRGDLIVGLKNLLKRTKEKGQLLDAVIIETTGLADPAPVAQTFFADDTIQKSMYLDGIVTVVDAKHILMHLHETKAPGVENEAVEQVAFADRLLINKIDLVDESFLDDLELELRKINKFAPMMRTSQATVNVDMVMGIKAFSLDQVLSFDKDFLADNQEHMHDDTVSSVGMELEGNCDTDKLNVWIGKLLKERGLDIFRTKGVLAMAGSDFKFIFQGIHMVFGGAASTNRWREDEKRTNRLVFIGRNLNREEIEAGFRNCLVMK